MSVDAARLETVAAAFRAGSQSYVPIGSPLYAALCAFGAEEPQVIALAAHAQAGAQPAFHTLTAIHFLLLKDPSDPLARYFASLTEAPLPAQEAGPDFLRFCRDRAGDIRDTLQNSTVQTTFVDRCGPLLAPLVWVSDQVGGVPLNLVEIGCSAGVLLSFDRYAYAFEGQPIFGPEAAALTLATRVTNAPPLRIPSVASRTGLDLNPLDARSPDDRLWLIALIFPEFETQRRHLEAALGEVAQCDIDLVRGDALQTLPPILSATPDPLCILHSVCLSYWSEPAKAELEDMLLTASLRRRLFRVGSEPSSRFSDWNKGRKGGGTNPGATGEITITAYENGIAETRVVAETRFGGAVEWRGW